MNIGQIPVLLPAVLSGLLLVLSLPKPDLYPLAWFALIPLLIVIVKAGSSLQAASAAYIAGVVYFAGTCYWIADTMIVYGGLGLVAAAAAGLLFVLVFGLCFAAFGAGLRYFIHRNGTAGLLIAPSLWTVLELVRAYVPFGGFPWMLSGYALVPYSGVLQVAAWTGIYGLSFLAVLVNSLLVLAVVRRSLKWLAAGALTIAISWALPVFGDAQSGESLHVRVVQTNIPFDQSWQPQSSEALFDDLAKLSVTTQTGLQLIVWPETPGPFFLEQDERFRERMQRIARENAAHFLLGYIGMSGDSSTNSAALLDGRGDIVSRYDKIHLVPFGEYVPLRSWWDRVFRTEGLFGEVGNFAAGTRYTVSLLGRHPVSTAICYESIFPGLIREFVKRGSELIVVITNDGWFGESSAPYQHLRMGVVRAVENRRYIVRSANTGISAIIDPYGRIESQTKMNERAALDGVVRFRTDRTFYTRYGDVFAYLNAAALLVAAVWKRR